MSSNEWKTLSISKLIEQRILIIGDGYRAKNSELSSEGYPFARVANINGGFHFENADYFPIEDLHKIGDKVSRRNDVVFTSKGTVGRFAFVTEDVPTFVYSPQLCYWRALNEDVIIPRFLFYWMQSKEFTVQANSVKGQTDMADYVSLVDQRRMKITLPPLPTQRRIADILSALDDKIELNRQTNATLEAMAQAIFQEWFVKFNYPGATGEMMESELGLIPKGWRVYKLADLVESVSITHKFKNGRIVFLNTSDIDNGKVLTHEYRSIKGLPGQAKKSIQKFDILFTEIRPANKRFALIDFDANDYVVSTKLMVLRTKAHVEPIVIYNFITSDEILSRLQMLAESRSGTFPQITFEQVKELQIILPTYPLLETYTSLVWSIFHKIRCNEVENSNLAQVRDTLLPKLMRGEINLDYVEAGL